jgi:dTDP-4-dehydrorhamnose reductase
MRVLITGASGLLGLNLALEIRRAHEVIGVDRNKLGSAPFRILSADLLDKDSIHQVLDEARPHAVIHCAAIADVDACERDADLARRTNAELPGRLAEACVRRNIRLIHISTDAVFSGEKQGAYLETDDPDPRSVYAATKLDGEQAVLQTYPAASIARVNFYGWSLSGRRSLAEFFVNNLSQGHNVNGFTDVTFCPMFVGHLGGIFMKMLPREMPGVYHVVGPQAVTKYQFGMEIARTFVGPQAVTKYQFGMEIARTFGLPGELISPQSVDRSGLAARRSHNLWLSTSSISTEIAQELPSFSTGLDAFYSQFKQGYPQKIRSYQQAPAGEMKGA